MKAVLLAEFETKGMPDELPPHPVSQWTYHHYKVRDQGAPGKLPPYPVPQWVRYQLSVPEYMNRLICNLFFIDNPGFIKCGIPPFLISWQTE